MVLYSHVKFAFVEMKIIPTNARNIGFDSAKMRPNLREYFFCRTYGDELGVRTDPKKVVDLYIICPLFHHPMISME